ncbi:MAG: sensor histidine kinase [Alphaproteobacteria bacterium]|nr:sensor histidine kinase [Alphaproteobacteria bacterium]MBU1515891.1 sensor histidine kinase [Alphaproteobacteria bacterium]MBU2094113.1 sensor histidine kinase [Alphaproteobacteria bacterium]MBU2151465.1 sensor histidine kinase [Alphaproteobacteria bacterium]MBU2305259.1 sensor histidine kinase [Alphaproteobacteria bacterium]
MFAAAMTNDTGLARELSSARAQLASQERQIQELNHRIANSLQLAADMLVFEQLRSRDPLASAALEASRARLVAVGELHRYLYDHAGRASVELSPFLAGLCQAIGATTGLNCSIQTDLTSVTGDMAQQLAIAINEFAINAAKHAYDGKPGGRLVITCRRDGNELVLTVADHGKGLIDGMGRPGGLGMSIVAAIVRDLRGAMTVNGDGGAAFTIRAPLGARTPLIDRSFQAWACD